MTDYAATDLHLAIVHHLLIFALAGVLAFEIGATRGALTGKDAARIARVDACYGVLAVAILAVGFSRAVFAAKGWDYYSHNAFFWAKISAFAVVGLLSIAPTIIFIRWRRAAKTDPGFAPAAADVTRVRRFLWLEVFVFAFIPAFAAAMARGYGSFTP
jgi:putative membrane protein